MGIGWILLIVALVVGLIAGNLLLLRNTKKMRTPPDFTPRKYDDEDDEWK